MAKQISIKSGLGAVAFLSSCVVAWGTCYYAINGPDRCWPSTQAQLPDCYQEFSVPDYPQLCDYREGGPTGREVGANNCEAVDVAMTIKWRIGWPVIVYVEGIPIPRCYQGTEDENPWINADGGTCSGANLFGGECGG